MQPEPIEDPLPPVCEMHPTQSLPTPDSICPICLQYQKRLLWVVGGVVLLWVFGLVGIAYLRAHHYL